MKSFNLRFRASMPEIILSQKCRPPFCKPALSRRDGTDGAYSPNVVEGVVDGALLWPALMLFEIGLQLRFGFIGVSYKFLSCPEC
jgi:hypothetical protein